MQELLKEIENGRLMNVIRIGKSFTNWSHELTEYAAFYGQLECLIYLVDIARCPVTQDTFINAAEKNHKLCLQYLFETCGLDYIYNTDIVTCYAAGNNNLECLKCAIEHGCQVSRATINAAIKNNAVDCINYLAAITRGI